MKRKALQTYSLKHSIKKGQIWAWDFGELNLFKFDRGSPPPPPPLVTSLNKELLQFHIANTPGDNLELFIEYLLEHIMFLKDEKR